MKPVDLNEFTCQANAMELSYSTLIIRDHFDLESLPLEEVEPNLVLLQFEGAPRSNSFDLIFDPDGDEEDGIYLFEAKPYAEMIQESYNEIESVDPEEESGDEDEPPT